MERHKPLAEYAREIRISWSAMPGGIFYGAVPYLEAMFQMDQVVDPYGHDSGKSIVRYFLVNASRWKGADARRIKLELKKILEDYK